jgi:hypothetical protein
MMLALLSPTKKRPTDVARDETALKTPVVAIVLPPPMSKFLTLSAEVVML